MREWMFRSLGQEFGPIEEAELFGMIQSGQLGADDEFRPQESDRWRRVAELNLPAAFDASGPDDLQTQTSCPRCRTFVSVAADSIGASIDCPTCDEAFVVNWIVRHREDRPHGGIAIEVVDESLTSQQPPPRSAHCSDAGSPTCDDARQPAAIGRFQLRETLGSDAGEIVYRVFDPVLDREVVLKVLTFGPHQQRERQQFLTEARSAARLRHPNIVTVHESGQIDDQCYISYELVPGMPLNVLLKASPPNRETAVRWVQELAMAVAFAAEMGIVHRHIKPANILMDTGGHLRITNFGLPCGSVENSSMTSDGGPSDDWAYRSPEQAHNTAEDVGPWSDQYSLGVVLYELLTGQRPYRDRADGVIAEVTADLAAICQKAMAEDPAQRYASGRELADDLSRWLTRSPVAARPPRPWDRCIQWVRGNRYVSAALLTVVIALGIVSYSLHRASLELGREQAERTPPAEKVLMSWDRSTQEDSSDAVNERLVAGHENAASRSDTGVPPIQPHREGLNPPGERSLDGEVDFMRQDPATTDATEVDGLEQPPGKAAPALDKTAGGSELAGNLIERDPSGDRPASRSEPPDQQVGVTPDAVVTAEAELKRPLPVFRSQADRDRYLSRFTRMLEVGVLEAARDIETALAQYKDAAALSEQDPLLEYGLGLCYLHCGKEPEAMQQFQKAMQQDAFLYIPAWQASIYRQMRNRDYPVALSTISDFARKISDNPHQWPDSSDRLLACEWLGRVLGYLDLDDVPALDEDERSLVKALAEELPALLSEAHAEAFLAGQSAVDVEYAEIRADRLEREAEREKRQQQESLKAKDFLEERKDEAAQRQAEVRQDLEDYEEKTRQQIAEIEVKLRDMMTDYESLKRASQQAIRFRETVGHAVDYELQAVNLRNQIKAGFRKGQQLISEFQRRTGKLLQIDKDLRKRERTLNQQIQSVPGQGRAPGRRTSSISLRNFVTFDLKEQSAILIGEQRDALDTSRQSGRSDSTKQQR